MRLSAIEPSLDYGPVEEASADVVGVDVLGDMSVLLVHQSQSRTWFCIADDTMGQGTTYGQGEKLGAVDSFEECSDESW